MNAAGQAVPIRRPEKVQSPTFSGHFFILYQMLQKKVPFSPYIEDVPRTENKNQMGLIEKHTR